MKNLLRQIKVSEHDFIVTPSMYIGLKYIEVDLLETIVSMEAICEFGTSLVTMFPYAANEYYYFNQVRLKCASDITSQQITVYTLDSGSFVFSSPESVWEVATPQMHYQVNWEVNDLWCMGAEASSTFTGVYCIGIKINTS